VSRTRVAVLVSGRGSNLQALLDALGPADAPGRIAVVISNRSDAGALERAGSAGIPTAVVGADGQDAAAILAALQGHAAQLVVLAGYLKRVPREVVAAYAGRMLNIHPALLPAFGGAGMYGHRVHEAVLASGARLTGVTVHLVDEQFDHGPIVSQWPVPVRPGDTADTLAARVLAVEHRLLPAVVRAACVQIAGGSDVRPLSSAADAFVLATHPEPTFTDALVPA